MKRRKLKAVTLAKTVRTSFDLRDEYLDGQPAESGPIEVENPHNAAEKITVFRKLRDDPLAKMHHRLQIGTPEFLAGRHWQRCHEAAELCGARAIDPTREAVDGGQIASSSITDEQAKAFADLAKASRALGILMESVVRDVLVRRMTTAGIAAARGYDGHAARVFYGRLFRNGLEVLAEVFGYSTKGFTTVHKPDRRIGNVQI